MPQPYTYTRSPQGLLIATPGIIVPNHALRDVAEAHLTTPLLRQLVERHRRHGGRR